jgi:hypothetical protein
MMSLRVPRPRRREPRGRGDIQRSYSCRCRSGSRRAAAEPYSSDPTAVTKLPEHSAYEERLQRRLTILQQRYRAGKVVVHDKEHQRFLREASPDASGKWDLSRVPATIRAMALAVEHIQDREQSKRENPLHEIQSLYFEYIARSFEDLHKAMRARGKTPHQAARAIARDPEECASLVRQAPEFLGMIRYFWENLGDVAHAHVEDAGDWCKGVFGGDLFPADTSALASSCGIYLDTLVLPDPFLRSEHVFQRGTNQLKARLLVQHGLALLEYRELALANVTPPIVCVLPDRAVLEKVEERFNLRCGVEDMLEHAGRTFGRRFESDSELSQFTAQLNSVEKFVNAVRQPDLVLFDTDSPRDPTVQLEGALKHESAAVLPGLHPGELFEANLVGRLSACNELLHKSSRLRATPVIEADTSWQYFRWKLEYDAARVASRQGARDLHIVQGLQSAAEARIEWLGNVPPAALIEIRKQGALPEFRNLVGRGIEELVRGDPADFDKSTDKIVANMRAALSEHRLRIRELSEKRWKFAKSDIGTWLVAGTIEIAAAMTGRPTWGVAAFLVSQLTDAPKLKEIPDCIRKLAEDSKSLKRSPVGILFKHGIGSRTPE